MLDIAKALESAIGLGVSLFVFVFCFFLCVWIVLTCKGLNE